MRHKSLSYDRSGHQRRKAISSFPRSADAGEFDAVGSKAPATTTGYSPQVHPRGSYQPADFRFTLLHRIHLGRDMWLIRSPIYPRNPNRGGVEEDRRTTARFHLVNANRSCERRGYPRPLCYLPRLHWEVAIVRRAMVGLHNRDPFRDGRSSLSVLRPCLPHGFRSTSGVTPPIGAHEATERTRCNHSE